MASTTINAVNNSSILSEKDSSGNVTGIFMPHRTQIGLSNSSFPGTLEVTGSVGISQTITGDSRPALHITGSSTNNIVEIHHSIEGAVFTIEDDGKTGIGGTESRYMLHVSASLGNPYQFLAKFENDGGSLNNKGIKIQCGADSPGGAGQCVYVGFEDGNGTASGGIQNGSTAINPEFFNGSDKRVKKDISPTNIIGLDVINGFEMVEFFWDQDYCKKKTVNKIGFIAQNCENIYPEMVSEHNHDNFDFKIKSISKGELVPVLVKAVQELSEKVESLQSQIDKLKGG